MVTTDAQLPMLGETVDVFGIDLMVTTYDHAAEAVLSAAADRRSFGLSALAVHGLMEHKNSFL